MEYGLLVHYEWRTGCRTCEVACRNERELPLEEFGIKVLEQGPWRYGKNDWEWDYVPTITDRCTMCVDRIEEGKKPACVHHCLAECLDFGSAEALIEKAKSLKGKVSVLLANK